MTALEALRRFAELAPDDHVAKQLIERPAFLGELAEWVTSADGKSTVGGGAWNFEARGIVAAMRATDDQFMLFGNDVAMANAEVFAMRGEINTLKARIAELEATRPGG